ncbi:uncharacterized protein LOC119167883 isoform X1 [Rhipicephalus microplus]|uniref:uncharacterized protein LOC119167883 isoform X1 n=1 Tax=Rhipicephalus microplus TaxID=6941 RepID=UPI003F6CB396
MVDISSETSGTNFLHELLGHRSTNTPMTADVPFLNEWCVVDCPASGKEKVAIDPLRMAVSAAPPHSIADTSIGRRNRPRVGLSSLPVTRKEVAAADSFPKLSVPGGVDRSTAAPFSIFALLR